MTEAVLPKRILLASDLSARCDRALTRAAQLAATWHGDLIVTHVVHSAEVARRDRLTSGVPSWRRPESWTKTLEQSLKSDLQAQGIAAQARIVVGWPADAIQQAVSNDGVGLVVLGIAKDAPMDRVQLGSTVDTLVRHSRVPVLNVRGRPLAPYRHVVVATDFSEPSTHALKLAAHWFAGARLTLFHACMPPGASLTTGSSADESWRVAATKESAAQLAASGLAPEVAAKVEQVVERGEPQTLLADYAASTGVDLVVLGSQGRSGVARALLGSTAENLLHSLDCDTLVIRRS